MISKNKLTTRMRLNFAVVIKRVIFFLQFSGEAESWAAHQFWIVLVFVFRPIKSFFSLWGFTVSSYALHVEASCVSCSLARTFSVCIMSSGALKALKSGGSDKRLTSKRIRGYLHLDSHLNHTLFVPQLLWFFDSILCSWRAVTVKSSSDIPVLLNDVGRGVHL